MDYYEQASQIFDNLNNTWPLELARKLNNCVSGTNYILFYLDNQDKEVLSGDISTALNMSTPRVSAALNALEKKEFIVRKDHESDARKTFISITEDGRKYIADFKAKVISFLAFVLEKIGIDEFLRLEEMMIKVKELLLEFTKKGENESC